MSTQETYTMRDLRTRYGNCAASTVYRRMREEQFPKPARFGRDNVWNLRTVHDWERIHMPHLHEQLGEQILAADDEELWTEAWAQMLAERAYQQQKERQAIAFRERQREERAKQDKDWARKVKQHQAHMRKLAAAKKRTAKAKK